MSQASHYLDVLTDEIGPRPAASDTERQAAEWLQDQFIESGLPVEMQDFEAPRSPQSARMLTYLAAPIAIFGIGVSFLEQMWVIHWALWLVLLFMSVGTILDLFGPKGPKGLIAMIPKGPSQNVIAKSVPSSFAPGESPQKVVLVSYYDTALTSPLRGEATAVLYGPLKAIANTFVILMPILALTLIINIAFLATISSWIWYFLLISCIPGVLLIVNRILARAMGKYSPGANNNASGIASLLVARDILAEGNQTNASSSSLTCSINLAAAEAKASKSARSSSKMPGVDYESDNSGVSSSRMQRAASVGSISAATARTGVAARKEIGIEVDAGEDSSAAAAITSSASSSENLPRGEVIASSTGVTGESGVLKAGTEQLEKDLFTLDQTMTSDLKDESDKQEPINETAAFETITDKVGTAGLSALLAGDGNSLIESRNVSNTGTDKRFVNFETVEFSGLGEEAKVEVESTYSKYAAMEDYEPQSTFADEKAHSAPPALGSDVLGKPSDTNIETREFADKGSAEPLIVGGVSPEKEQKRSRRSTKEKTKKPKKSFFSFGKKKKDSHKDDPSDWLGIDGDFNARTEGKSIGSWDNFGDSSGDYESMPEVVSDPMGGAMDDGVVDLTDSFAPIGGTSSAADAFGLDSDNSEDGFNWRGGFAGEDPIEDDSYASAEAARIRRKVLTSLDVELKEKEVWFVATGAHFAERAGVRALMEDYGDELRSAIFINISATGAGDLYWSTKERFGKTYLSSARLTSMMRRISRQSEVRIRPLKKKTLVSEAGPILAAGRKAITLTRLNEKDIPAAMASQQDTAARLDNNKIDEVAKIACNIIREA